MKTKLILLRHLQNGRSGFRQKAGQFCCLNHGGGLPTRRYDGWGNFMGFLLVAGMFLAATSSALATVRYVNVNNANPTPPYTNWATAATNIQSAVDAAGAGDEIVVTNGIYAPVEVYTPLTLQSVNGPDVTIIDGGGTASCVYLATNALVVGFTLTNGVASSGGGVYCESSSAVLTNCVLTGNYVQGYWVGFLLGTTWVPGIGGGAYGGTLNNCTLTGNSAYDGGGGAGAYGSTLNNCTLTGNSAGVGGGACGDPNVPCTLNNCTLTGNSATIGGGASDCTLNNCTLTGNSARTWGGGACACTLNNCTVTGNSADVGGGARSCTLNNCIVYFNTATDGANHYQEQYNGEVLTYCCTTPMPTNGVGNITNAPLFVNAAAGNYHLSKAPPASTPATTPMSSAAPTWTAIPASSSARWTSALTNIKHRLPSFPMRGSSNMACPPTARRITPTWMAPA